MGGEALCQAELGLEAGEVLALLESHEVRLRGTIKATLSFGDLRKLRVNGEVLEAQTPQGPLRLHLGAAEARKWLSRIECPPTLAQKLGVLADAPVHLVGSPPGVASVLEGAGARMVALADAQFIFIAIATPDDLRTLDRLVPTLPQGIHLWVLRQKGKTAGVKEGDIMAALRAHGLAPSKTAAWSEFYAADRYGRARDRR